MPRRLLLLNGLLLLVAVGAAGYIVEEVTTPPRPAPLRRAATTDTAGTPPPTVAPPPAPAAYSVVTAHNLFSPSRSEAPVTAQGARPAVTLPKPTLHGVVLRNGAPIAYLEDPQTKRVAGYRLGDAVAGGTVQAINADHVVLTRPEGPVDVRLRDPAKPRPAAAAPPRTTGAPGAPGAPGPQQPTPPGVAPPLTPGVQPGPTPFPPRRMLPPNVLRRVPPATGNAQP